MAWTQLAGRLTDVPLVIAGPMLRKVTDSSVTVWLALKEPAEKVFLEIFPSDAPGATRQFSGERKTVPIGQNLHLVAVTARRLNNEPVLTAGTVYSYDLSFTTKKGNLNLASAVGSSGKAAYAYGSRRLPSFALPPADIESVRLIQGSCRKPNAGGPDALAMLDDMIEAAVDDPTGRPHQLILTGDQIYADEVADVLLLMLTDAASALMVDAEPLPGGPNGTQSLAETLPPGTRAETIKDEAKLTSADTQSHLMSFGEYLAMYLFVWSDVLWPANLPDFNIPDFADLQMALTVRPDALFEQIKRVKEIGTQRANALKFRKTVLKVRRALANVPTAMIFDDHEITDDWNMSREFCKNVYGSERGMRIVQNGLLAYALCQHWGNAPEQFEPNPAPAGVKPAGVKLLELFAPASKYRDIADHAFVKTALGLHTPEKILARSPNAVFHDTGAREKLPNGRIDSQSLLYHYTLEAKAYQVIVTDTRTWRSFPLRGDTSPPDMIEKAQLSFQIGDTPALNDRVLLLVASTNMPPGPTIRQGVRDLPILVRAGGKQYLYEDFYDSWDILSANYARTLSQLSSKFMPNKDKVLEGSVVVLSGDVHTSSASRVTYSGTELIGNPAVDRIGIELSIAQLIGSALHNQGIDTEGQHNMGYPYVPASFKSAPAYVTAVLGLPKITINVPKLMTQPVILTEGFVGWHLNTLAPGTVIPELCTGSAPEL